MNPLPHPARQALSCHPADSSDSARPAVQAWARAWRVAGNGLGLRFLARAPADWLMGLPAEPVTHPGERADGLWQRACLEAFAGAEGTSAYVEFNHAPDGRWAAYDFAAERIPRPASAWQARAHPARLVCATKRDARGHAVLTLAACWPDLPLPADAIWRVGLSAVLQAADGALSHWALRHPAPRPDFHHPASRALRLPPP